MMRLSKTDGYDELSVLDTSIEKMLTFLDKKEHGNNLLVSFSEENISNVLSMLKKENDFKSLGYEEIGYQLYSPIINKDITELFPLIKENEIPFKINYCLSSSVNHIRDSINPHYELTIDETCELLKSYLDLIEDEENIFFKNMVEIIYFLREGINDSRFELAYLMYYVDYYNIPLTFLTGINRMKEKEWYRIIHETLPSSKISKENINKIKALRRV